MSFDKKGYEIVRNALSKDLCKFISYEFNMLRDNEFINRGMDLNSVGDYVDSLEIYQSFSWYSPYCFEAASMMLHPIMERVTNKQLLPTYTYGRIYYNGASMKKHTDRPSCEYSATLCISNDSDPWEIWMEGLDGVSTPVFLEEGDMCVYYGPKVPHWRDTYTGRKQIQAFMHFVDANGSFSNYKLDGRRNYGMSYVGVK
jgi:hypothetical protein